MSISISIRCCNYLFSAGIKQLIEGNERATDYRIGIVDPEDITAKTDLIIADYHSLSRMSIETLVKHKVGILLLFTGCLPRIQDQHLLGYISKGLIGVLPLKTDISQLKKAIKCVLSGELWLKRRQLKDIIFCLKNGHMEFETLLTSKEIEIVKAICKGYRNKEITKSLSIGEQSVKKHLNNIYKKVGITDRLQLAVYAVKHWPLYFSET